jgi:type IX secretion system PorP/SprF family membrane protein
MKFKFILILGISVCNLSFAQSVRFFNFYNYDPKLINPAFAGLTNQQEYSGQVNVDPKDSKNSFIGQTAFSTQLKPIHSGIGAMTWHVKSGGYVEDNISMLYNYQVKLGEEKCLSIGTQLGYSRQSFDASYYSPIQPGDPLLVEGKEHNSSPVIDFGLAFRSGKFYIGLSTTNLVYNDNPWFKLSRYYSVYSMYEFKLTNWLRLQPSVFAAVTKNSNIMCDLNEVFIIKDKYIFGARQLVTDDGYEVFKFNAGIDIKKTLQILVNGFSINSRYSTPYQIEAMVRARIPNGTK